MDPTYIAECEQIAVDEGYLVAPERPDQGGKGYVKVYLLLNNGDVVPIGYVSTHASVESKAHWRGHLREEREKWVAKGLLPREVL